MGSVIGSGTHRYRFERNWAKLPRGWSFGSSTRRTPAAHLRARRRHAGRGRCCVLARGAHPVMVFDREGQFVTSWGEGCFSLVHGVTLDAAGHVWIADIRPARGESTPPANCCAVSATASSRRRPGTAARSTCRPGSLSPPPATSMCLTATATGACINSRRMVGCCTRGARPAARRASSPSCISLHRPPGPRLYRRPRNDRSSIFDAAGEFLDAWTDFVTRAIWLSGGSTIYVGAQDGLSIWTPDRRLSSVGTAMIRMRAPSTSTASGWTPRKTFTWRN